MIIPTLQKNTITETNKISNLTLDTFNILGVHFTTPSLWIYWHIVCRFSLHNR